MVASSSNARKLAEAAGDGGTEAASNQSSAAIGVASFVWEFSPDGNPAGDTAGRDRLTFKCARAARDRGAAALSCDSQAASSEKFNTSCA